MDNIPTGTVLLNPVEVFKKIGLGLGMTVGDFGCGGAAHFTLPAARIVGNRGVVWAVDILKSALSSVVSKARLAGLGNIRTVWSNLEIFGATKVVPDNSVDVGLIVNVIHQTQKPLSVLKEAGRMIKTGGKLTVIDWKTGRASFGPSERQLVLPDRVKQMASELKLTAGEEFEAGPFHYGLVLVK